MGDIFTDIPRGIRNNNPLNLRYNSANKWKGRVSYKQDQSFEEFVSIAYGVRAFCRLIQVYVERYHCSTIRSIVYRFAPPTENDTPKYYKYVRDFVGMLVDPRDFAFMVRLTAAMWNVENGCYPSNAHYVEIRKGVAMYLKDYGLV